jgi:hypothetical protein
LWLGLSVLLELADEFTLGPASELWEVSEDARLSERLHSADLESGGHNHALLVIIRVWDTVKAANAAESGDATGRLVGEHSTHSLPEHAGGGGEMLEATAGVGVDAPVLLLLPLELSSEEWLRDFDLFTADNDNALATEQLSCNNRCKAATKVTTPVNDNLLFEHA